MAACAGCSAQHTAPMHGAASIIRSPVAAATTAPATAPSTPAAHRGARHHHARAAPQPVPYGVQCQPAALQLAQRHYYRAAHIFQVIPPNDYQALSFAKPRYPILAYCRAGDPGHTVDVSPVEPTLRDILYLRITGG